MKFLHIAAVTCNQMCTCDRVRHREEDAMIIEEITFEGISLVKGQSQNNM